MAWFFSDILSPISLEFLNMVFYKDSLFVDFRLIESLICNMHIFSLRRHVMLGWLK